MESSERMTPRNMRPASQAQITRYSLTEEAALISKFLIVDFGFWSDDPI
jgi:hypothetical protein